METRLIENGVITEEELRARIEAVRPDPASFALPPAEGPDELSELVTGMVKFGGLDPARDRFRAEVRRRRRAW